MPNKTIDMITIRQTLRLHALGKGSKYISQATGVARNTVKKYLQRFSAMQTTMDELDRMGDAELSRVFFASRNTVPPTKRASDLAPLLPAFAAMLKRGVTKGMAYRAYALQCPGG